MISNKLGNLKDKKQLWYIGKRKIFIYKIILTQLYL